MVSALSFWTAAVLFWTAAVDVAPSVAGAVVPVTVVPVAVASDEQSLRDAVFSSFFWPRCF